MTTENTRFSYIEYVCDGTTTTFQIPFNYIEQDDLTVYVDGVETAFTFTSANTVEISPAPASGTIVRLRRFTDADERAVDFRDGSVLTEADLDTSATQIFNVAQEAMDQARDAVTVDADGRIAGQGRQIKNVADPTENHHAVNLDFIQTEYGNVTAVKNNEGNINIVASDVDNVITVSSNIADVNTVADDISNVNVVAGHVPTLDANYAAINTVSDNIADVANLSAQIDGVLTVAASFQTQEEEPTTANVGDRWFQPSTNTLYLYGSDSSWYEAAVYSVVRSYVWRTVGAGGLSFVDGNDSDGNLLYIPANADVTVTVDGFTLTQVDDYTIVGTSRINFTSVIPSGSTIQVKAQNPMLQDEYTWFEARRNETEAARDAANTHRNNAETFKNEAFTARDNAAASASDASDSEANALAYRDQANTYKGQAQTYASNSLASSQASEASATEAQNFAIAAARQDMEAGSAATAGLPFVGDPDTGLYKPAANELGITAAGNEVLKATQNGIYIPSSKTLDAPIRSRGLVQMVTWGNSQTKQEVGTGYTDLRHSAVNFTPKFSDSQIIYEFNWTSTWKDTHGIGHYRIYKNGSHQSAWDLTVSGQNLGTRVHHGARFNSWGSGVTQQLKIIFREYNSSNEMWAHATQYWDGGGGDRNSASWGRVMEWRN